MNTTDTGRRAESIVARFLQAKGCSILAQNWRTRECEIDIIATRGAVIYFCEVKYRVRQAQGRGLDYITPKKLAQMRFAAVTWLHTNGWRGSCELCAFEVSGPNFTISNVVKGID